MDASGLQAHERLIQKIREGIANETRRAQLYLGTEDDRDASERAYAKLRNGDVLLREARRIKRDAISHLDENVKAFSKAAQASGTQVHYAADGVEAVRVVMELVGSAGAKRIVKSKSITGEEIELRQHL